MKKNLIIVCMFSGLLNACAQDALTVVDPKSGLKLSVINKDYPLLKLLLPNQLSAERGIEIEFPEHVTGKNVKTGLFEHLYLVTRGDANKRSLPVWTIKDNTITYKTTLNEHVRLIASAKLDSNSIRYSYTITNNSNTAYHHLQAVTCIQLYSDFSDTLLQRTYVHHSNGFDLIASETPDRLTMTLEKWLPCRYLVSYTWPVPGKKVDKDEDGITRYNKSRNTDMPLIATLSHNKKWVTATFTTTTGNLWTNPERSCHHADPEIMLQPGETKSLQLTSFVYKGTLDMLFSYIANEKKRYTYSK